MANYEWYRSFVAVYQTGTTTAAAEQRSITQPAISQHVAALESTLNTPLFERQARKMQPTEEAKELYSQIIGAVEKLDEISQYGMSRQPDRQPPLRVGTPQEYFFSRALGQLAKADTHGHRIWVSTGSTRKLLRQLEGGDLDVVIATQKLSGRRLHLTNLYTEKFILVHHSQLIVPSYASIFELETWLSQQSWISYAPDLPIIRRYWLEVFESRPSIKPEFIFPDLRMVIKAVQAGMGISIVPQYLCQDLLDLGQIKELQVADFSVTNQLYLAAQIEHLSDFRVKWLINILSA
ncbi:MAG: LysR family transcriptional regulator [Ardenticatenaceae bacterium]|nr:LysR family transcriptional regulator [Ardenticatenaceae bacterium]